MFFPHNGLRGILAATLSVLLAFPALAAAPSAQAPPPAKRHAKGGKKPPKEAPGSSIEGRVFESDGKTPVRGVEVSVRSLDGGEPIRSQPTDPKGRFSLRKLPYGWNEVSVLTGDGEFLVDQAIDLPPGSKVVVSFSLIHTADRPAGWWKARADEVPGELLADKAGLAESKRKLTGTEYWKSPAGIAILASVGVVALAAIAIGGRGYSPPSSATPTTPIPPTTP